MLKDDIKKRLITKFPNSYIEVEDMTMQGNHFSILVISEEILVVYVTLFLSCSSRVI